MSFIVGGEENIKINIAPQSLIEEITQNLRVLLSTPKFSVPLDRGLGLSGTFIDKPAPVAQTLLISEIYDVVELYEPRVEILNVTFGGNGMTGRLYPKLEVRIIG